MSSSQTVPELLAEYSDFDRKRQGFIARVIELLTTATKERDEALIERQRAVDAKILLEWKLSIVQNGDLSPVDSNSGALEHIMNRLQLYPRSDQAVSRLTTSTEFGSLATANVGTGSSGAVDGVKPYVLVLLDASSDAFVFRDALTPKSGKSGAIAAEKLNSAIRQYLELNITDNDVIDVVVKAYANMEGLCQSMLSRGASAASVSELRPFFSGFSGRFPLCDFSDVGPSKGRAAEKIRGVLDFHLQVHACKHIILGLGLGSDTTEHFATFDMNVHCLHRMTMLRNTSAPLSEADIEQLGPLRTTQFNTVFIDPATHFRNGKTQEPSYSVKTGEVTSYAEAASHALSLPQVFTNTAAAAPREPKPVPLAAGAALAAITTIGIKTATGTQTYRNSQAHPERLGPPLYNKRGKRVDRLLSVNKEALDWVRKGNLCPYLFLRGECKEVGGPKCRKQHSCRPLDDKEWNALWLVTRTKECRAAESRDGVCRNPTCVFGHHERD